MTHSSPPAVMPRSAWMRGRVTFTTVTSSWIMNVATHMTRSVNRRRWAAVMQNYLLARGCLLC